MAYEIMRLFKKRCAKQKDLRDGGARSRRCDFRKNLEDAFDV
jgi:hypothetical protein